MHSNKTQNINNMALLIKKSTFFSTFQSELINYTCLCICIYISILIYLSNLHLEGFNYFGPQVRRIADAMLFSLPILFTKKKALIFPYLCIVNIYLLSIVWYYRNYNTPMPLPSYFLVNNLQGLGKSIIASIRISDLFQILPSIIYCIAYYFYFNKKRIINYILNSCMGAAFTLFITGVALKTYYYQDISVLNTATGAFQYMPARGLKQMGILQFWISQIQNFKQVDPHAVKEVDTFLQQRIEHREAANNLSHHSPQNLILILVESFCSWTINCNIEGVDVTPCINKLIKEEDCLYFPHVLPQVKDGRSSDSQLLINTGLLPINSGATSTLYAANTFPSLPKALNKKGYTSLMAICDDKRFWNQEAFNTSFGFEIINDRLCHPTERVLSDSVLLDQSLSILCTAQQPFYAELVTISMHQPYTETVLKNDFKQHKFNTRNAQYYCIATHYTDHLIGKFIEALKQKGLYKNSIVIITGDHDDCGFNQYEGRSECGLKDRFIPFIILNSHRGTKNEDKTIGQVDLYPSLLSLMNIDDYPWQGLGENIFNNEVSNCAIYHTGENAGSNTVDSVINYRKKLWRISDIIIRSDYFNSIKNRGILSSIF